MPQPTIEGVIELFANNWDDYSYQTTFFASALFNGKVVELGSVKILIDGEKTSSAFLDRLRTSGWDGVFPIPGANYISVPGEITFYEQLEGMLETDDLFDVAMQLRDASYLVRTVGDEAARTLTDSNGFRNSLQRERGNVKAFIDGWQVFERRAIAVLNLGFTFKDQLGNNCRLNFRFQSESPLPHDINVIIGPNGAGKSQALHQIVQAWIQPAPEYESAPLDVEALGFGSKPNLSQIVVVSYSPFERFPVDLQGMRLQDTDAYKYYGFRGRASQTEKLGRIELSHDHPKRNAAHSLINCAADDLKFQSIRDWARKTETMETVLRTAFDFDFAAVEIPATEKVERLYRSRPYDGEMSLLVGQDKERRFVPITPSRIEALDAELLAKRVKADAGVAFFRNEEEIELSSGQRLFAYIVINILGSIRRNSLLLVDEPELFLHPTLEIQFVDMLKTILRSFNSKALLATHSVVTVREVPSDCVHVFERTEDGLQITHPPFQTFGGDVQRISSYVFGDKSVSKPFESWIRDQLVEHSPDALIDRLGREVSEELIVQIRAMGRGQW